VKKLKPGLKRLNKNKYNCFLFQLFKHMFGTMTQSYEKNNTNIHLFASFLSISVIIFMKTFSQTFAET